MYNAPFLKELIRSSLEEDIGTGDITTMTVIDVNAVAYGTYTAKEEGVVFGLWMAGMVFSELDPDVEFRPLVSEGDSVRAGDVIATVKGNARSVLSGERVGLNFMQHLSGIATRTRKAVDAVRGTGVRIADTRKTTPGMRALEKMAVKAGGGSNHRFNLADGIMIKDNHIVAAGGIAAAVAAARANAPHTLKIEVEVENESQLEEALNAGADIIMLDNMDIETMRRAVAAVNGRAVTEASGNMGDRDLAEVASTGVDIISIGALTHSVKALDISLKFSICPERE